MDDVKKMLRAIINGQSSLKDDLTRQVIKSREESEKRSENLDVRIDELEKNLTNRINRIGLHLADLDDDAPSRDELDELEKRVEQLEQQAMVS